MRGLRTWYVVCLLGLCSGLAQALQTQQSPESRNGISLGVIPFLQSNLGSFGIGVDSSIVNAGIVAIALTAAAVIVVLLIPGLQLSYGGTLLNNVVQSRQLGLNGPGGVGLMTLFSVATDIYSKMDTNDVVCQKKVICEFMRDNSMFGTGANSVRSGIQYATSFLQNWGIPYITDIREAASLNTEKDCAALYKECDHISLKESYDNSVKKVFGITEGAPVNPASNESSSNQDEYEYEYYDRK